MYVSFIWRRQCCQVLSATSSSSLCYLKDLFSAAVSNNTVPSYNLHIVNYMLTWKLTNPHFLALMSPEKNSMQFNQLLMSWFRVKMHENVEVIPQVITVYPALHIKIMWSGEWACVHYKNMVLFFNPWTR